MIAIALLIAAADVPQSLLDQADAANLAHTQCMFQTMRQAGQAHVPPEDLERRMKSACAAQERALRVTGARIYAMRGHSNPQAEADAEIEDGYRSAVEEYRQFPEFERQLRGLQAICKADPKSCN
jgi:hypothetical protein